MKTAAACLIALLAACPPAVADAPPALPDDVAQPSADSGEAGLWMVLDQAEAQIKASPLLVKDPALNNYVHGVVCRLAAKACGSLRIYVMDDPSFNASAAPNGMVIVHTGLLLRAENEAQLGFVLGHEITHYLRRHTWDRFERARRTSDVLAFLSLGVAAVGVGVHTNLSGVTNVVGAAAVGALFAYSRDQEREADAGGFALAVAAGYDPRQGSILWTNVQSEDTAETDRHDNAFFANHPTDKERIANMAKLADDAEASSHAADLGTDRYTAAVAPYRAQWLDEELNRGHLSQSVQMIGRLIGSDPRAADLQYYLGEAYRRRNGQGDLQSAIVAYRAATADTHCPAGAYRGLGIAALKTGDRDAARTAFQTYLAQAPSAEDRAMVQSYIARIDAP